MQGSFTPGVYLVATPIGNLGDITLRALDVLKAADVIACEDTRVSRKLLGHYGIKKPLMTYHDHNGDAVRPDILKRVQEGQVVALISDAGSPLISDPGFKLVRQCHQDQIPVTVIPGASSVIAALSIAAQPTDRFLFAGFWDKDKGSELANVTTTLVFFESSNRLLKTLEAMRISLANRSISVVREITKLYEDVKMGSIDELIIHYTAHPPKGEIVLVVGPPSAQAPDADDITTMLQDLLKTHRVKDACALVAGATGLPRKQIYQMALDLQKNDEE